MSYQDYTVRIKFNSYVLPYVQSISDPKEGSRGVLIEGTRADGSIFIPSAKKSQTITVNGIVYDGDGYVDLTTAINALKNGVTTAQGTLSLQYWDEDYSGGGAWVNSWEYTVVRIDPIEITDTENMRTQSVNYSINFVVLSY